MKNIKNFVAVIALSTLSFGSFAADYVKQPKSGTVRTSGRHHG